MRTLLLLALVMAITGIHDALAGESREMFLRAISDYGGNEKLITEVATPEIVRSTMQSLDWSGFHQVILERPNSDWMEVGGSLDPSDGLSVMYQEAGSQHVIKEPPKAVEQMTQFLLSYLSGGQEWKRSAQWE